VRPNNGTDGVTGADPGARAGTPAAQLGELLCRAIRALGKAGDVGTANRLAARAWWVARDSEPAVAARLNGVMHHLETLSNPTAPTIDDKEQPMPTTQLDVRSEAPARRHELILSTYADLRPGDGFVLVNDHDPKPLYYQFAAEYPDRFTWDYLEAGPQVWKVRIGRPDDA